MQTLNFQENCSNSNVFFLLSFFLSDINLVIQVTLKMAALVTIGAFSWVTRITKAGHWRPRKTHHELRSTKQVFGKVELFILEKH